MSTITCTNFLRRECICLFEEGKFLLAGSGSFLELYDLEKFIREDFNSREYEPTKTRVFEKGNVQKVFVLDDSGHVMVITSDYDSKKGKLDIRGNLVHREQVLEGGYANLSSTHDLINEEALSGCYSAVTIPNTSDVLLLTASTLKHIRYSIDGDGETVMDVIAYYDMQSSLPSQCFNRPMRTVSIGATCEYTAIFLVDTSIVLLKREKNKWICRSTKNHVIATTATIIPELEMAVLGGTEYTTFISTKYHQPGVSKDQLRILNERYDKLDITSIAYTSQGTYTHVYVIRERNLVLWRIDKNAFTIERVFVHSSAHAERRSSECRGQLQHRSHSALLRKKFRLTIPDLIYDFPLCSLIRKTANESKVREQLIITYESGDVKVINTAVIFKHPLCSYISIGSNKMQVESLYPCWEFPLDPVTPLTRLTGLRNGIPILIKLENGSWTDHEIVQPSTVRYSNVKWSVCSTGDTIVVFYNKRSLCFCLFGKDIQWKEDRLECDIKNCFISDYFICIITATKMMIVDIRGFMIDDADVQFINASLDYATLACATTPYFGGQRLNPQDQVVAFFIARPPPEDCVSEYHHEFAQIYYKDNDNMRSIAFTRTAEIPYTRETTLQELFDRPFTGQVIPVPSTNRVIEIIKTTDEVYELHEDGRVYDYNEYINMKDFLPLDESVKIRGFITIEAMEMCDRRTFVLAKANDYIYLKSVGNLDDATGEPLPSNFGDNPVFGHFVGPISDGKCALYTTSSRKYNDVPELIRVEARVNLARKRESLQPMASLFQPDTKVRIISINKSFATVISTFGKVIELQDLSRKGKMSLKKEIEVSPDYRPAFTSTFDICYSPSNILFIIAASPQEDLTMVEWDANTNSYAMEGLFDYSDTESPPREDTNFLEVFFFAKECATESPALFVSVDETIIQIHQYSRGKRSHSIVHRFLLTPNGKRKPNRNVNDRCLVVCNGDDNTIHDIWRVNSEEAVLYCGRKNEFGISTLTYTFSNWRGVVESIALLSTRKKDSLEAYADLIFAVKDRCRIGVLATFQKEVGHLPTCVHFTELCKINRSLSIAIHPELLNCSPLSSDQLEVNVRLFVAKRNYFVIYIVSLEVGPDSLHLKEKMKLEKIATCTVDPSYLVVTNHEQHSERESPKYGIISGCNGTEIIRVCPKKLRLPQNNID